METEHSISVRDTRTGSNDPALYVAHCRCGWIGVEKPGPMGERDARWDGRHHLDRVNIEPILPR
jgi:hypothetical protein